jgi:outer membrane biosynthesis protein TonB
MSTTEIPAKDPATPSPPAQRLEGSEFYEPHRWESAYRDFDADSVPHLLIQLQDDLARSRRREAAWLSIIVHLVLVLLVVNEAKLEKFFFRPGLTVVAPKRPMQGKELTYLELPPDQQKTTKRPDTNIISDKDRIATSKKPQLDPKELKKILDSSRPGAPGISAPPAPQSPAQPPAVAQNAAPQPTQQNQQEPPGPRPSNQNQMAKLQMPPVASKPPKVFGGMMSAESAIQQAARATLENRSAGYGGNAGDYGLGQGQRGSQVMGPAEVLSDTMGVDFGPYLQRILHDVKQNWYLLIPDSARPPIMKKGKLSIEFAIIKNGQVPAMQLVLTSGDVALDRAAWASITNSQPFPPLPPEFHGDHLSLRFNYYYNPDKNELE